MLTSGIVRTGLALAESDNYNVLLAVVDMWLDVRLGVSKTALPAVDPSPQMMRRKCGLEFLLDANCAKDRKRRVVLE